MYRIDNATAATTLPTPRAIGPRPNGFFTDGNPGTLEPATVVDDDWLNALQEEIANVITSVGITLDKATHTQLAQAIPRLVTNTANTWTQIQTLAAAAVLANNVFLNGKDTSGAAHALIGYDGSNTVHMFSGSGGLIITKSDASAQNVVMDDEGNINFRGAATASGMHVPNNNAFWGTDTSATQRLLMSLASDNNVYTRVGPGGFWSVENTDGTVAVLQVDNDGNATAKSRMRATSGAIGSGDASAATILGDYNSSLGSAGWKIYPDKTSPLGYTIRQWFPLSLSSQTLVTNTFPLAFPNACFNVTAQIGTSITPTANAFGVGAQAINATQYQIVVASAVSGGSGIGVWVTAEGF